ncbi:MAG: hypothetical protein K8R57_01105 [Verrucomicrobia bacterium]|nr:hypothetical protein [Verrucomicrobiota bacterium]
MPRKSLLMLLIGLALASIGTLFILCSDPTSSATSSVDLTDDRASGRHGTQGDIVQATRREDKKTFPRFNDAIQGNTKEMALEPNQRRVRDVSGITISNPLPSPIPTTSQLKVQEGVPPVGDQLQSSEMERSSRASRSANFSNASALATTPSSGSTSTQPMSGDQSSSVDVTLEKPPFYSVDQEQVAKMSPEAQQAYAGIQQSYIDFYNEWKNHYPNDPRNWNEQMKKFHFQMLLQLGSREVDRILR